jgi:hypothetical protein
LLRGRAHGTLHVRGIRVDAELALTGGFPASDQTSDSSWFNYAFEVAYVGWRWAQPFVSIEGTACLSKRVRGQVQNGDVVTLSEDGRTSSLSSSIPARPTLGLDFAVGPARLRVFGQLSRAGARSAE